MREQYNQINLRKNAAFTVAPRKLNGEGHCWSQGIPLVNQEKKSEALLASGMAGLLEGESGGHAQTGLGESRHVTFSKMV